MNEEFTKQGKLFKFYFFVQRGLGLINEFKNLIAGIIALYFAGKFTNIWLIPIFFIGSLPILALAGWYSLRLAKVSEKISLEHGTHYALNSYKMTIEMRDSLKKIAAALTKNDQSI